MDKLFSNRNIRDALFASLIGTAVFALLTWSVCSYFLEKFEWSQTDLLIFLLISSGVIFISICTWSFLNHADFPSRIALPSVFILAQLAGFSLVRLGLLENALLALGLGLILPLMAYGFLERIEALFPIQSPGKRYLESRKVLLIGMTYQQCRENPDATLLQLPYFNKANNLSFEEYQDFFKKHLNNILAVITVTKLETDEFLVDLGPQFVLTNRQLFIFSTNHIEHRVQLKEIKSYMMETKEPDKRISFAKPYKRLTIERLDGKLFQIDGIKNLPSQTKIELLSSKLS